ncbi:hypothetical protein M408DRAFT_13367, partial [Serendipita vermifera MAFF 305830]
MQFGLSSVISKKERLESSSDTRVSFLSNMFAALNSSEATPDAVSVGSRAANSTSTLAAHPTQVMTLEQSSITPPSAAPTPAPQQQQQQQQQQPATSGPAQPSQDAPPRPLPKQQGSFDSPSMRPGPLPLSHPPNQTPPMQPGNGPASYHFTPPHLRQAGNGAPGANPPRSPSFNRTMTNGNMRGPPGAPGS